ncbi:hypothetical protein [Spirosoma sordidisoli]|uniref:Uncharacterized protein n=1 Tax=Spirosoma sordidisoli TaxID=2502893 RepID=A0A4Q2UC07_9BACT|nr:hypothetical protein [Spirosoma sordidisoli]RYC66324.1 hypothetical protein EQG79_30070 [Spirosoma sordidisoli]
MAKRKAAKRKRPSGATEDRVPRPPRWGIVTGRHPVTGVLHRIAIDGDQVTIERQPIEIHQLSRYDGRPIVERLAFERIEGRLEDHQWLVYTIWQHPEPWPADLDPDPPISVPPRRENPQPKQPQPTHETSAC